MSWFLFLLFFYLFSCKFKSVNIFYILLATLYIYIFAFIIMFFISRPPPPGQSAALACFMSFFCFLYIIYFNELVSFSFVFYLFSFFLWLFSLLVAGVPSAYNKMKPRSPATRATGMATTCNAVLPPADAGMLTNVSAPG